MHSEKEEGGDGGERARFKEFLKDPNNNYLEPAGEMTTGLVRG